MIFDTHVHLLKLGAERLIDEDELSLLLERADTCGVDRTLLLGAVTIEMQGPSPESIRKMNDQTIEAVERHPARLSGLCYLNPQHGAEAVRDEMDRCIAQGPLVGVKQEIAVNARDERLDPILEHCAKLDCPLLFHSWYKATGQSGEESNPSDIAHLARRHPDVRLIMAHMMGCGVRGMSDVAGCANVHVDVSGAQPFAGIFEYALGVLGAARILYGSDWPIRDFATQVGKVESQALSGDQREAILWKNLHRLLGRRSPCSST